MVVENKFTPGPWKAYVGLVGMQTGLNPFYKGLVCWLKNSGEDNDVAVITDSDRPAFDYEANARLIAAAPELLDALQALISAAESGAVVVRTGLASEAFENLDNVYATARAAIAKALGGDA